MLARAGRLADRLAKDGKLRDGVSVDDAFATILVANSFDTTRTLRERGGLSVAATIDAVEKQVRTLLADPARPMPPELSEEPPEIAPTRGPRSRRQTTAPTSGAPS